MPKLSILMATYRRAAFIARSIQSAQEQNFKDWELIIVDDSEDNDCENVVKPLAAKDARIKYFHREKKGTIANSSNYGLERAEGDYIAILDDDDWWIDPEKSDKQIAFLDSHPDYVGCGGGFEIVNGEGVKMGEIKKPETDEEIRRVALYANPMANSTTMFRRTAGITYDESLPQFADWEFWLHIGTRGRLYNFPDRFLAYRMWDQSASFKNQKQNADTGYRIVRQYQGKYPGFVGAILLVSMYRVYARLPLTLRTFFNSSLSRLKKTVFSG